jgi:hypothetical protein
MHTYSISTDRDTLYASGAISHMLELIMSSKSWRARTDACDALRNLIKTESACKSVISWTGKSPLTGEVFDSGLTLLRMLQHEANPNLQRAGIAVIGTLLTSDGLKHSDRISASNVSGLCDFARVSDEFAAKEAMIMLGRIVVMIQDKGLRWVYMCVCVCVHTRTHTYIDTDGKHTTSSSWRSFNVCIYSRGFMCIHTHMRTYIHTHRWQACGLEPIVDLFKVCGSLHAAARAQLLRACLDLIKEGDYVNNLLCEMGLVKYLAVFLASRTTKAVDGDDTRGVRLLTQLCEGDASRQEEVCFFCVSVHNPYERTCVRASVCFFCL